MVAVALLRRLVSGSIAYQSAAVVSAVFSLATLRLYTEALSPSDLGYAENVLTAVILLSIVLRAGLGEALVRFWSDAGDEVQRAQLARQVTAFVLYSTTIVAAVVGLLADSVSVWVFGRADAALLRAGVVGVWAFTNLEIAYAILRVRERRRVFLVASLLNVAITISLTITLVVVLDLGAIGYVLGNYIASACVLVGVWGYNRTYVSVRFPRRLRHLWRFGAPTVPADVAIFGLNVVDRSVLLHQSPLMAGQYALAAKLSTVMIVIVRAFQAAWPPLAYSLSNDVHAAHVYARIATAYVAVAGLAVSAITLSGDWLVRLVASDPAYEPAVAALPWVSLGWGLYGFAIFLTTVTGRAEATLVNFPVAFAGLAVNFALLTALIGPWGIVGAGVALCGAYVVIVACLLAVVARLFPIAFQVRRIGVIAIVCAGVSAAGVSLLPSTGIVAVAARGGAFMVIPALFLALGAINVSELRQLLGSRSRVSPVS